MKTATKPLSPHLLHTMDTSGRIMPRNLSLRVYKKEGMPPTLFERMVMDKRRGHQPYIGEQNENLLKIRNRKWGCQQ